MSMLTTAATESSDDDDRREHLTFRQAATYLGLSQRTLERRIISAGLLPWDVFAGSKRIRRAELVAFADSRRLHGPRR